ncbi:transposase, MuDR, MULE transposase domain protein [Tanacetum coccineum]|uniref:Transposase, MuDR, MULE transposase domain protein n=1 Tax=Tanacetum coccineum TaxID=301880 RepID=A0ABQ5AMY5_9ASTR
MKMKKMNSMQKYMSFKPDIPETPLYKSKPYKSKPMVSKHYKKEIDVKVGQNFENKKALDLAIILKALDEGYQFLSDRSAPERTKKQRDSNTYKNRRKRSFRDVIHCPWCVDATHFKGQYKGTNLMVVGMDENNQIVPIAFGICKGETGPCWSWWMSVLKECIGDNPSLLFISDKHAAIALVVQNEFPLAYHVAYTTEEFSSSMSHLQDIQPDAYDKLCQLGPQRWKLPVLKLAETYRAMVQEWYYQRRKLTGTCQCRKWQLSGIPCGHVIAVISLDPGLVPLADALQDRNMLLNNPKNVRLSDLAKLQEALDEEDILADQILTMMHRYADRFTNRRVEINNLMVLQDHPLVDYDKYALGCMTGADMKKCVHLKNVRDELLRSMEEKRQLMANYRNM